MLTVDISGWDSFRASEWLNSYIIERSTSLDGQFDPIAESNSTMSTVLDDLPLQTEFIDRHVSSDTRYFYRVRFVDYLNNPSPPSNIASVKTSCEPPFLPLSASCAPGRIALDFDIPAWAMESEVEFTDFIIMRSTSPDTDFTPLAEFSAYASIADDSRFSDFTATGGPFYYYYYFKQIDPITGFEVISINSEIASADPATCAPPEGPELVASCRDDRIVLRWVRPAWATGEVDILDWFVERAPSPGGPFNPIPGNYASQAGGIFIDDAVSAGVQYYYRVSFEYDSVWEGFGGPQLSPYSEVVSASPCNDVPVKGPMDIAFVLDNTGSMDDEILALKNTISEVLDDIVVSSGNDYRLSIVTTDENLVNVRLPFSQNNRAAFEGVLSSLTTNGGSGAEASTDECLNTVVNGLAIADRLPGQQIGHDFDPPFGEDETGNPRSALKFVILFADARPGGFDGKFNQAALDRAQQYSTDARMNCVRIAALQCGTDPDVENVMVGCANATCGWYSQTPGSDPEVIMDMILSTIYENLPDCVGSAEEGFPDCSL